MAKKFCEKCLAPTEMSNFECSQCGGSSFVHKLPSADFCDCGIPDIEGSRCKKCSQEINPSRLAKLGKSGFISASATTPKASASTRKGESNEMPQFSATGKTIDDLIRAQNRTTHAVRAIARYLLHQLTTVFAVTFGMSINLGNPDGPSDGATIFIGLVFIAGTIYSFALAWHELAQSD